MSQFTIDSNQNNASKILVNFNGKKLVPYKDYVLSDGILRFADELQVLSTTEVIVTWSNPTAFSFASTFQIFHNMNGETSYNRIAACEATTLTHELTLTDTVIRVADASKLDQPSIENTNPGVIFIAGERITYYTVDGNTLGQIMRGTEGTGTKSVHEVRSIVANAGEGTKIPQPHDNTWYDVGVGAPSNGLGLQNATTTQAKFLKEKTGLTVSRTLLPEGFSVYVEEAYVEAGYVE